MYDAIYAVHKTKYVVGNSGDALCKLRFKSIFKSYLFLDPAAGASDDYSKSIGIKYVYTVEVRPGDGDTDDDEW